MSASRGTGITPIMSLIPRLDEEPASRFTLFYGNRDSRSVIFLEALADLKDRIWGSSSCFIFSPRRKATSSFHGILDAGRVASDRAPGWNRKRRRLVHLRTRTDDGRGGGRVD